MAPKGNKNAVGNKGGRPPKYDLLKEAEELLSWSSKDDSTSLYQFTDRKDYLAEQLSQFAEREPEFASALKKAKERIGQRREQQCSTGQMNYGVWNRSAALYHKQLHHFEESIKDADLNRKIKLADHENEKNKQTPPREEVLQGEDENIKLRQEVKFLKEKLEHLITLPNIKFENYNAQS